MDLVLLKIGEHVIGDHKANGSKILQYSINYSTFITSN